MRESGNQEKRQHKQRWHLQAEGGFSTKAIKVALAGGALAITAGGAVGINALLKDENETRQPVEKQSPTAATINKLPDCDPDQTTIRVARDSVTQQYGQMVMCERSDEAFVYVNDK